MKYVFGDELSVNSACHVFLAPSVSEEDELYEECICETNLVYQVVGEKLIEVEKYCRKPLKHSMLQNRKVRATY